MSYYRHHDEKVGAPDAAFFLRKRYLIIILLLVGSTAANMMASNMSICIVQMASNRTVKVGNTTVIEPPEFVWSTFEEGMILSLFSWGYMTSIISSIFVLKFGGVIMYGIGTFVTAILTVLTPTLVRWNMAAFFVGRILEGVFESFGVSSKTEIIRQWSPPGERSRLISVVAMGPLLGKTIGFPINGFIAYHYGWEAVFYATGINAMLVLIPWCGLVRNTPKDDKFVTEKELRFLSQFEQNAEDNRKINAYPWKRLFTSKSIWVYCNCRFIESWSTSFVNSCLPLFFSDVYGTNIRDIGVLSGIPHLLAIISLILAATLADYLRKNKIMKNTTVHKLYISLTQLMAVVLLSAASYSGNFFLTVSCICIYRCFSSFESLAFCVLPIDMGGKFSSVIMALGTTISITGNILNPMAVGLIVKNHSISEWRTYFILLGVLNTWSGIIYALYGSGETQQWTVPTNTNSTDLTLNKNEEKSS